MGTFYFLEVQHCSYEAKYKEPERKVVQVLFTSGQPSRCIPQCPDSLGSDGRIDQTGCARPNR
jgi:hypothetical protein